MPSHPEQLPAAIPSPFSALFLPFCSSCRSRYPSFLPLPSHWGPQLFDQVMVPFSHQAASAQPMVTGMINRWRRDQIFLFISTNRELSPVHLRVQWLSKLRGGYWLAGTQQLKSIHLILLFHLFPPPIYPCRSKSRQARLQSAGHTTTPSITS